ncbi:ATPase, T2SS/T4P/T4SS family [Ralstonia pseudosolanacearum]|uniref:ATPase, T2SS/T4P/T4SS family n=1 Tax=Ralstonia pseudosolanacearum TaxID=1310165 RepID=UPI001FF9B184|nr:ATPase, T2SS/T4P/T4SS family [Ralstonia pseudosolanacearum]
MMDYMERQQMVVDRFKALTFAQLIADGVLTADQAVTLTEAIRARKTVVIAGPTATGKTTLLQAIANEAIASSEDIKVAVIESPEELVCGDVRQVRYQVSESLPASVQIRRATREGAHWLIVGELRQGADTAEFLAGAACGVAGVTTMHLPHQHASTVDSVQKLLAWLIADEEVAARGLPESIDLVVLTAPSPVRVLAITPMDRSA